MCSQTALTLLLTLIHTNTYTRILLLMKFWKRQRERGRGVKKFAEKEAQMSFCLSHMGLLRMLHSLSSKCRDLRAKMQVLSL